MGTGLMGVRGASGSQDGAIGWGPARGRSPTYCSIWRATLAIGGATSWELAKGLLDLETRPSRSKWGSLTAPHPHLVPDDLENSKDKSFEKKDRRREAREAELVW